MRFICALRGAVRTLPAFETFEYILLQTFTKCASYARSQVSRSPLKSLGLGNIKKVTIRSSERPPQRIWRTSYKFWLGNAFRKLALHEIISILASSNTDNEIHAESKNYSLNLRFKSNLRNIYLKIKLTFEINFMLERKMTTFPSYILSYNFHLWCC